MKRLITSMLIVLLISVAFIGSFYKGYYSYADDIDFMSDKELEAAYQAYLQSKGGGLLGNAGARLAYTNGKMLNFLTSDYNTTPFKNINQVKGLLSWEKAELESGNSSVLQLTMRHPEVFSLYTQWLLQNHYFGNDVSENDGMFTDGTDNTVYSGQYFVDNDGIGCLVYMANDKNLSNMSFSALGTPYKFTPEQIIALVGNSNYTFTFNLYSNTSVSKTLTKFTNSSSSGGDSYNATYIRAGSNYSSGAKFYQYNEGVFNKVPFTRQVAKNGQFAIMSVWGEYWLCALRQENQYNYPNGPLDYTWNCTQFYQLGNSSTNATNTNVIFYTNINNNIVNYPDIDADGTLYIQPKVKIDGEYKPYTINEGDTIQNVVNNYYNDSGEKDKTITVPSNTPPSSGGGGGSGSSGGTPPNWSNPYPNLSPDGNGGFNFNFTLPDLNIDWNINGLSEKFPFSIPFDLIRFVSILNAEPETPHFEGTVNLIVYEWNIDADLSDFDNLAGIVRNVEFIGFCITLILITRRMIKG